jgi:predicted nucleic acid-binding Zn ribbon protein
MNKDNTKTCLDCGEAIIGRSDKKFCSDVCRNSYNNQKNSDANNYIRNVNNLLRRNRRILEGLLSNNAKVTLPRQKVVDAGFSFMYFTNSYTTRKGAIYNFVYEYGYLALGTDMVMIVKRDMAVKEEQ